MHVTECVFFKRTPIGDHEFVYELWSREFGKIRAFAKEKKNECRADTGSVIQANVETKGERNRLVSFKVRKNLSSEKMDYAAAVAFLKTVSALSSALPEGIPNRKLFEAYEASLPYYEKGECRKASAILLSKLAKTLGTYALPENASPMLKRFDTAISSYDVGTLHSIKGIDDGLVNEAFLAAELALARYHF
ncbi:MAG: rep/recomb RecO protein [Patescibacteria group bacterium]|nr:rep/recomb RecO protein [Patescibacteria group bacterium]